MAQQHKAMNQLEIQAFLQAPRFVIVGTNRRDGPPQLTPVWYLHQRGQIFLSMDVASAKYRNLKRDPRIALCIAGDHPDARSVMMYGTVEFVPGDEEAARDINWKITRRYYDSDAETREYLDSVAGNGDSAVVVVTPDKVIAQDYN